MFGWKELGDLDGRKEGEMGGGQVKRGKIRLFGKSGKTPTEKKVPKF